MIEKNFWESTVTVTQRTTSMEKEFFIYILLTNLAIIQIYLVCLSLAELSQK